ncbi:hypothetical protein PFMALIP_06044, partial [Plasmodium falciparum MaliPS096_E11]
NKCSHNINNSTPESIVQNNKNISDINLVNNTNISINCNKLLNENCIKSSCDKSNFLKTPNIVVPKYSNIRPITQKDSLSNDLLRNNNLREKYHPQNDSNYYKEIRNTNCNNDVEKNIKDNILHTKKQSSHLNNVDYDSDNKLKNDYSEGINNFDQNNNQKNNMIPLFNDDHIVNYRNISSSNHHNINNIPNYFIPLNNNDEKKKFLDIETYKHKNIKMNNNDKDIYNNMNNNDKHIYNNTNIHEKDNDVIYHEIVTRCCRNNTCTCFINNNDSVDVNINLKLKSEDNSLVLSPSSCSNDKSFINDFNENKDDMSFIYNQINIKNDKQEYVICEPTKSTQHINEKNVPINTFNNTNCHFVKNRNKEVITTTYNDNINIYDQMKKENMNQFDDQTVPTSSKIICSDQHHVERINNKSINQNCLNTLTDKNIYYNDTIKKYENRKMTTDNIRYSNICALNNGQNSCKPNVILNQQIFHKVDEHGNFIYNMRDHENIQDEKLLSDQLHLDSLYKTSDGRNKERFGTTPLYNHGYNNKFVDNRNNNYSDEE